MTTASDIQQVYVAYFNRPADVLGLQFWLDRANAHGGVQSVVSEFANSKEYTDAYAGKSNTAIVDQIYMNLFGRHAEAEGLIYWALKLQNNEQTFGQIAFTIANSAQNADLVAINSKVAAASAFTTSLDTAPEILGYDGAAANQVAKDWLSGINTDADLTAATTDAALATVAAAAIAAHDQVSNVGTSFTLTSGANAFTGGAGDDTFVATDVSGAATWTVGDKLDGGAGNDNLSVISNAAISVPLSATVKNIESASLTSNSTISVDATSWTGLTSLSGTGVGALTLTGAATTDIVASDGTLGAAAVTINGGNSVTVTTASAGTGSTVAVGGTTAAAGAVAITSTTTMADAVGATVATGTAVTVTGGTTINVTNTLVSTGGSDAGGDLLTGGKVTVNGTAATTSVTVTETGTSAVSAGATGHAGFAAGQIVITDKNATSLTAAGSISSVTLDSFGATSSINSSALKELNLAGKGVDLTVTTGALTTPTVSTLALGLKGISTGTVTLDTDYTTLNIAGTVGDSTLTGLTAAGVTTLNISGDHFVDLTQTMASLTSVVSTNSSGVALENALAIGTSFSGGAGDDSVVLTGGFTKAISMGAGADTVTYGGAAGTGGSVDAGTGVDTIALTLAQAVTVAGSSTFNSKFTGFEIASIDVAAGGAGAFDVAGINNVKEVSVNGGATGLVAINNIASGGTLDITGTIGAGGSFSVGVANATFNAADTFNVALHNSTAGVVAFGSVTVAGVETVNINATDDGTGTANTAASIDTVTLVATGATSVVVTGHNGLNLTNAGNTAITSFNASGVTADTANDTSANLAVTFASANTTAAVSITGGAGDDSLTGNLGVDTIHGGAGNDAIVGGAGNDVLFGDAGNDTITGGADADIMTGGAGNDTFVFATAADTHNALFAATNTIVNNMDSIVDFNGNGAAAGDTIQLGLGANVFGAALQFTGATTATVTAITVATAADLTSLFTGAEVAHAGAASTNAVAQIYDVTVTAGALAGHYLIINNDTAAITSADTIINIVGVTGALNAQDFTFA